MVRDGFLGMINFKQRKALDSVARNLDYLDATVKNFLSLSRLEQGEMVTHARTVLVRDELVTPALESFTRPAEEKEITLSNLVPPDLTLAVDPDLLLVALNNLISNAVKYGSSGGQVIVSGRQENQEGMLEVYNDGRPLTAAEQELLFKKFSRVRSAETKSVKGTGLGLYITRQIVAQHGGTITVQARPNGNAFIIRFERRTGAHGDTAAGD
jgi:signal transduction histidine kinase